MMSGTAVNVLVPSGISGVFAVLLSPNYVMWTESHTTISKLKEMRRMIIL